jgi:dTDP-4-amino-4,6-dideoxygalactose transaminase
VYYPLPVYAQPAYAYLGYRAGEFPVSERLCASVLSLPMHPQLTAEQQAYIIECMGLYFGG